jgi:hypothetical protein
MSAESQNYEASREPLLGNGSANKLIARHWLSSRHMIATTDTHATIELLEAVFSVRFVPWKFQESTVRGTFAFGSRYQATPNED